MSGAEQQPDEYDLIHELSVPVALLDEDGVFLSLNPTFTQHTGIDLPSNEPLRMDACLDPEHVARFAYYLRAARGVSGALPCRCVMKSGLAFHASLIYARQRKVPCFILQGQQRRADSYLQLNRRLSETREALLREQNQAKRHEAAIKGLDDFLTVLMHDIRSPLCTIWTALQLAQEDLERHDLKGLEDMLDSGVASTKRLMAFVDRLYQNIRVGQSEPELELIDISRIVDELREDLLSQFRASGAQLSIVGTFPEILADRHLTRQLFQNLMQNAMKFRSPERSLRLELGCLQVSEGLYDVYLKDNGQGFSGDASKLFERYHKTTRKEGDSKENEGMGIGLATCKLIADKHGWSIRADSKENLGSTFTVRVKTGGPIKGFS